MDLNLSSNLSSVESSVNFSAFLHCPVKFLIFVFKKELKTVNIIFHSLKLIRLICTIFYQAHILLDNKIKLLWLKKGSLNRDLPYSSHRCNASIIMYIILYNVIF